MTALPSISSHSSSLYPSYQSSPLIFSSKTTQDLSLPFFTVKSNGSLRGRSSTCTVPRGLKVFNAATKPAKSPAEEDWKIKRQVLLQKKVRSVDVKEALRLQKENNFVILDVRPEAEFKEAHPPEENPEFIQTVESKIDKSAKIIVGCSAGGTMRPSQNLPEGQQSRSLIAAYLLVLNGYTNVFHLEGGLYQWFKEGLPAESEE
ncbi:hypothetical protein OIU78_029259 [Salix suchowensis]|nr:hypothetical protein OIU78_029259 [Salix suchowensis]